MSGFIEAWLATFPEVVVRMPVVLKWGVFLELVLIIYLIISWQFNRTTFNKFFGVVEDSK